MRTCSAGWPGPTQHHIQLWGCHRDSARCASEPLQTWGNACAVEFFSSARQVKVEAALKRQVFWVRSIVFIIHLVCISILFRQKHFFHVWINENNTLCFPSDAEPKYLVAVQPIPVNDVKKQCTGSWPTLFFFFFSTFISSLLLCTDGTPHCVCSRLLP